MRKLSELNAEEWALYSRLLDEGLARPEPERTGWLQSLPPEHFGLIPVLEAALKAEAEVRAGPNHARPHIAGLDEAYMFETGRRIGPYRLIEPLGRGGMGEVWRAQRDDDTLKREVALKLPHTWLLTAATRMRLSRERDILAGLSHSNIAQLYDAGLDTDGQPWLALEWVHGRRIDEHCRQFRLSIPQRLALFEQVLDAVQSAHARLTVHRDLKPTNILVTDAGTVKLLDFGIAKLINEQGTGHSTELTQLTGRAATPDYAAPEQLAGDTITVGTDVYALGVVLYELLCGQRPFGGRRGATETAREFLPLASGRVHADHAAHCAGLSTRALSRMLAGDIDAILAKALAPKPADRYGNVERLAEDLRRHRRNEPIEARHITRAERAYKFMRRNKVPVMVMVTLVIALATSSVFLREAVQARKEADHQASTQQAVTDFLTRLLASGNPFEADGQDFNLNVTVLEVVDKAAQSVGDFDQHPEQEAAVRLTLARIYLNTDNTLAAEDQTRKAIERAISMHSREGRTLENQARLLLLEIFSWTGNHTGSREELVHLRASTSLTPAQSLLSDFYEASLPHADDVDWSRVQDQLLILKPRIKEMFGHESKEYLHLLNELEAGYDSIGPPGAKLSTQEELLDIRRKLKPSRLLMAELEARIADEWVRTGSVDKGLKLLEQSHRTLSQVLTPDFMPLPAVSSYLGNAYRASGRYAEAESLLIDSWERLKRTQTSDSIDTEFAAIDLAMLYLDTRRPEKALRLAESLYAATVQDRAMMASKRWKRALLLGRARMSAGRLEQGRELLIESHAAARAAYGADHWLVGCLAGELAYSLILSERATEAAALIPEALLAVRKHLLPTDPMRKRVEALTSS